MTKLTTGHRVIITAEPHWAFNLLGTVEAITASGLAFVRLDDGQLLCIEPEHCEVASGDEPTMPDARLEALVSEYRHLLARAKERYGEYAQSRPWVTHALRDIYKEVMRLRPRWEPEHVAAYVQSILNATEDGPS